MSKWLESKIRFLKKFSEKINRDLNSRFFISNKPNSTVLLTEQTTSFDFKNIRKWFIWMYENLKHVQTIKIRNFRNLIFDKNVIYFKKIELDYLH